MTWIEISKELGIAICPGSCGAPAHRMGFVDDAGTVHWLYAEKRSTTRGLTKYLVLVALVFNPEFRKEPPWLRLYHQATWSYWFAKSYFHQLLNAERFDVYRRRVYQLARRDGVYLRRKAPQVAKWVYWKGVETRRIEAIKEVP